MLYLTVAVYQDRTGVTYGGPLEPDENVPPTDALRWAIEWLRTREECDGS